LLQAAAKKFGFARFAAVRLLQGQTVAKRGRPRGATSWWRNPANYAAHHATALMERWLANFPEFAIRYSLFSLAASSEYQALIEECWRARGNERRYTVPPKIKRKLCRLAVAHVVELQRDAILRRRIAAARKTLRTQGWSEPQIAEILRRMALERIDLELPDLEKVVEIVNRQAPATTLRRKAASRKLRK
jgi:hypothetical protein